MIARRHLLLATSAAVAIGRPALANLPGTMVWTSYDLGSSGYAEASGIADAIMKKHSVRVRIVPSGTSIGRLLPLKQGRAQYGFLANELYFAAEATYDFAAPAWGPQDVRVVLARPAGGALACAGDVGINGLADLRGKRIGYVRGNPSVNVKSDAYLAFAGLTRDDVEVVWFGSYNAMKTAVINNQLDCFSSVTTSANMREIQASPRGLTYPQFPPGDERGWSRLREVADFFQPYRETAGAGISAQNPVNLVGYRYPILTTYANTSADEVYELVKAMDQAMDQIRTITSSAGNWAIDKSGHTPADAPWHDGAIRYLKERGIWSDEDQAWQDRRLARLRRIQTGWEDARGSFSGNGDDAWLTHWEKYRVERLGLPPAAA